MPNFEALINSVFPEEVDRSELRFLLVEFLRGICKELGEGDLFSEFTSLKIISMPNNKFALYDDRQKNILYSNAKNPEEIGEMLTARFHARVYELVSTASRLNHVAQDIKNEIFADCIEDIKKVHGEDCSTISSLREAGIQV